MYKLKLQTNLRFLISFYSNKNWTKIVYYFQHRRYVAQVEVKTFVFIKVKVNSGAKLFT